jgi:hypothetical protein
MAKLVIVGVHEEAEDSPLNGASAVMPPRPSFKSDAVLGESSQAAVFDAAPGAPGVLSELCGLGSRRAHAQL